MIAQVNANHPIAINQRARDNPEIAQGAEHTVE